MNRHVLVWAVLVLALSSISVAADAPPAGALRWDTTASTESKTSVSVPTYTFGTPVSTPYTVGVDDFGRLYVYDELRQCIDRFTPTGELDKCWLEDTGSGHFSSNLHEFALLPDEKVLFCTSFWPNYVLEFGPDPSKVEKLSGLEAPRGFAAWQDGSYVVYRRDPDGKVSRIYSYSAKGELLKDWESPEFAALAPGPDGLIYATGGSQAEVFVYDRAGNSKLKIDANSFFVDPSTSHTFRCQIAIDRNGDIYLSDDRFIVRLDKDGNPIARWLPFTDGRSPFFGNIGSIAVRNGLVYALIGALSPLAEIQEYTADGQCIARYQPPDLPLDLPAWIAVQPDGSYAVDQASANAMGRTPVFDATGKKTGDLGGVPGFCMEACPTGGYYYRTGRDIVHVDADGSHQKMVFDDPEQPGRIYPYCVDETGRIHLLCDGSKLLTISPSGEILDKVQLSDAEGGYLNYMAVDPKGFIYFGDTNAHQVRKFRLDGSYVGALGKEGAGLGDLRRPRGVTVDSEGRLLVCDARNNRIQAFSRDGEPLGVWGRYGKGDGELDRPNDLALGPNQTLYIADTHNDRIVIVPLADFWKQLTREIKAPPAYVAPEKVPMPIPGEVTVEGIVVAGTDDFTDCVYIQAADRSWGTRVTMPSSIPANRGERIKVTGTLELKEHAAKHIKASKSEFMASVQSMPGPLGMANLYVGDGYRMGGKVADLSNLGLLIKSWGRVLMVDPLNSRFVISDGSRLGNAPGLEVYGGQLKAPLTQWPKVGQYVMVTGISAVRPVGDGTFHPAIRLRAQEDLQVLVEN